MPKISTKLEIKTHFKHENYPYNIPLRYLIGLVYDRRSSGKKDIGSN
jgi:hypothetical protein